MGLTSIDKSDTGKTSSVKFDRKFTSDYNISEICKKQVEKSLLWPKLHHTWTLRSAYW